MTLKGDEFGGVSARNIIFFIFGMHLLKIDELIHPLNRSKTELNLNNDISGLINRIEYDNDTSNLQMTKSPDKSFNISQVNMLEDTKINESQIGTYCSSEKFFFQSFDEQIKINKLFQQFLTKKATNAKCAYFIGKDASPVDPRFTYRPEINTKSAALADNIYKNISMLSSLSKIDHTKGHHRVKSSACSNYKDSHSHLLMNKGLEYKHRLDERVAKHTEEELKACTFWPKVNKPTIKDSSLKSRKSSATSSKYFSTYKGQYEDASEASMKMLKELASHGKSQNRRAMLKLNQFEDNTRTNKKDGNYIYFTLSFLKNYIY